MTTKNISVLVLCMTLHGNRLHAEYSTHLIYLLARSVQTVCHLAIAVPRDRNSEALDDPRVSDELSDSDAASRVHLQAVMKQVDTVNTQPLRHRETTGLDLTIDDSHIVGRVVKRQTATQQCIQQNPHAPHVHLHTDTQHT